MVTRDDILNALEFEDMGTKEMREKFGKWPKSLCDELEDEGKIQSYNNGRKFYMINDEKKIKQEISQEPKRTLIRWVKNIFKKD